MRLLEDSWPVDPNDSANALITLARVPWIEEWGYHHSTQRLWWRLSGTDGASAPLLPGDIACRHLVIKQRIARCVSEHSAQGWE